LERSRILVAVAIAVAPVAGLIGFGCSDDDPPTIGMTTVDPGGTFGAEVQVRVVGRGRVSGNIPTSIDCPGDCYARYTFTSQSDKGAADGLTLKAISTPGARFVGWTFEAEQLGTRARGPDNCSPVKRATSQPGNNDSPELKLSFGEVNGTAPPGQEGSCVGDLLKVPVAYKLVATFEDLPVPPEAGPDADGGDGGDGGANEILFSATPAGTTAREIGIASGYVYWKWENGSFHGVSYGFPGSSPTSIVNPGASITQFEVDSNYVLYQGSAGSMFAISGGGTSPTTMSSSTGLTCAGLASDGTSHYCRTTTGQIHGWTTGGTGPTLYQTNAPTGADLAVDTSYFFIPDLASSSANLYYVLKSTQSDAGPGSWTQLITGRSYIHSVRMNASRLFWLEYNSGSDTGQAYGNSSKFSSTFYQVHPATTGLRYIASDPSSSTTAWLATTTQILRATYSSGVSGVAVPFRSGLTGIGGIAVDNNYVYWTQSDGRVYRASKF
jgi:hypothetical protein